MDFNSLKDQVSNLTLYDIKAGVRKVQNAVMNYTEMEAKVREATNNEPWGTSTTAMQEIAGATFNYQLLNEIMPMIYKRFTEKTAEEWRQIYKALQLLEYLVKNGSERVIDDARSHMSLLKMLRQFYFTDPSGKDQGVNVRHRSKELVELLGDVEKIRAERKKARALNGKALSAVSVSTHGGFGGQGFGGTSRQGGFSESATYGGFSGGVYGDGGGFGGNTAGEDYGPSSRDKKDDYEEYNEFDEGVAAPARDTRRRSESSRTTNSTRVKKQAAPPKPKEPEVDLFDFGDDDLVQPTVSSTKTMDAPAQQGGALDDDDFDDFQSAAAPSAQLMPSFNTIASPPPFAVVPLPPPSQPNQTFQNASTLGNPSTSTGPQATLPKTMGFQAATPNYFTSVSIQPVASPASMNARSTVASPAASTSNGTGAQQKQAKSATSTTSSGGDAFANLLGATNFKSKAKQGSGQGMSMQEMAKQKSSAGLWGPASSPATALGGAGAGMSGMSLPATNGASAGRPTGGALDDLLG